MKHGNYGGLWLDLPGIEAQCLIALGRKKEAIAAFKKLEVSAATISDSEEGRSKLLAEVAHGLALLDRSKVPQTPRKEFNLEVGEPAPAIKNGAVDVSGTTFSLDAFKG